MFVLCVTPIEIIEEFEALQVLVGSVIEEFRRVGFDPPTFELPDAVVVPSLLTLAYAIAWVVVPVIVTVKLLELVEATELLAFLDFAR